MSEHAPDPYQRLTLFAYTVEGLAPVYRGIMEVFAAAKARFRIQLRPDEVVAELERSGHGALVESLKAPGEPGQVERALDQLVSWGNLRRGHDTARVATLEDFRRRHFVYQITPAGEAAERAVGEVVAAISSSGSLQTVMLGAIEKNLGTLADEVSRPEPRPAVLYEALFNVFEQFRALTENASTFMTRLNEAIEAGEVHDEAFLVYKAAVIAYLEDFIGDLTVVAPRVAERLRAIEGARGGGAGRLAELAARADRAPTLDGSRDVSGELARQWRGLSVWFLGERGAPPTVDLLRGEARTAIHRILQVLERLHEKRFRRMDGGPTCSVSPSGSTRRGRSPSPATRSTGCSSAPSGCSRLVTWAVRRAIRSGRKSGPRCPRPRVGGDRRRSPSRRRCGRRGGASCGGAPPG